MTEVRSIPSNEEIREQISKVDNSRDKAFLSVLYLTGARISEIVKRLKVKDIQQEQLGDRLFYVFYVYTEKRKEKKAVFRRNGIPYDNNKFYLENIINYIKRFGLKEQDILFNFDRKTGQRVVKKWMDCNPHFLRHIRVSHLTSDYGFNARELMDYIGWSDIRTTVIYTHLDWKHTATKL